METFFQERVPGEIIFSPITEAAVHRCSSKYVFFKILQYSQGNNCVGISF